MGLCSLLAPEIWLPGSGIVLTKFGETERVATKYSRTRWNDF